MTFPRPHAMEGLDRGRRFYYADEIDVVIERLKQALREALTEISDGAATPELIEYGINLTINGHYENKKS